MIARSRRGSWRQRMIAEVRGRFGLDAETLVDPNDALLCWFAEGQMAVPQQLDAIELALAAWLSQLEDVTRKAYQGRLRALARRLQYSGPRPVRTMLERASSEPEAFERELAGLEARTGTVRAMLGVLHLATKALVSARVARRALAAERPRDTDLEVELVRQEQIDRFAAALEGSKSEVYVRTRAVVLLTWATAIKSNELIELALADVHLEGRQVIVGGVSLGCTPEAIDALRTWIRLRGRGAGPLFVAWDGRSRRLSGEPLGQRQLQRSLAEAADRAGVERFTLRGVRNGALLLRAAVDPGWAQEQARNASEDGVYRLLRIQRVAHGGRRGASDGAVAVPGAGPPTST